MSIKIKYIERFAPGDSVPEWMVAVIPDGDNSIIPEFKFTINCNLVEIAGTNWLLPEDFENVDLSGGYMAARNGSNVTLKSSSTTFYAPLTFMTFKASE